MDKNKGKVSFQAGTYSIDGEIYTGNWSHNVRDGQGRMEIQTSYGVYIYDHLWSYNQPDSIDLSSPSQLNNSSEYSWGEPRPIVWNRRWTVFPQFLGLVPRWRYRRSCATHSPCNFWIRKLKNWSTSGTKIIKKWKTHRRCLTFMLKGWWNRHLCLFCGSLEGVLRFICSSRMRRGSKNH